MGNDFLILTNLENFLQNQLFRIKLIMVILIAIGQEPNAYLKSTNQLCGRPNLNLKCSPNVCRRSNPIQNALQYL
jgi:hypothetical protein